MGSLSSSRLDATAYDLRLTPAADLQLSAGRSLLHLVLEILLLFNALNHTFQICFKSFADEIKDRAFKVDPFVVRVEPGYTDGPEESRTST